MRIAVKMPLILICLSGTAAAQSNANSPVSVNVHNFVRAETDHYFGGMVKGGGFGKLSHRRAPSSIDAQDVVRDTLYSSGVFDLDAAPVTITLPDAGKRFMSMQVLSQDQYTTTVVYAPGSHTFDRNGVGTRYVAILIRTLVNSEDAKDIEDANRLQDAFGSNKRAAVPLRCLDGIPHRRARRVTLFRCLERSVAPSTGSETRERSTRSIL
jgi:hypothetical protein